MHDLILTPISVDELTEKIALKTIEILEQKQDTKNTYNPDELLTREQTCELLQINLSTLFRWTNKRKVIAYGIGNRRYYKKSRIVRLFDSFKKIGYVYS